MNRRRWIGLAAVWSAFMSVILTTRSVRDFRQPAPLWMGETPQWYDDAFGAGLYTIVGTACVIYLARTRRSGPQRRWRDRVELRVVLYCLAGMLALQFPLGVVQAARALNDRSCMRRSCRCFPSVAGCTRWWQLPSSFTTDAGSGEIGRSPVPAGLVAMPGMRDPIVI